MSLTRADDDFAALLRSARAFITEEVIPREDLRVAHDVAAIDRVTAELRARAMPGLIEIARWDTGHAMTRSILGRLAGMSEENINKMGHQSDDVENLINAVQKVK